jgi:hypothetical protein
MNKEFLIKKIKSIPLEDIIKENYELSTPPKKVIITGDNYQDWNKGKLNGE